MKSILLSSLILFVFLFFFGIAYADLTIDFIGGVCGIGMADQYKRVFKPFNGNGVDTCVSSANGMVSDESSKGDYSGGNCTFIPGFNTIGSGDNPGCTIVFVTSCCDPAWVASRPTVTGAAIEAVAVPNVPMGSERDAAAAAFQQWSDNHPFPDRSSEGLVRTDAIGASWYSVTQGADGTSSDLVVTVTKQVGWSSNVSNAIPLSSIVGSGSSGSSGGSTLDAAGVATGVGTALDARVLSASGIGNAAKIAMDGAFDRAHDLGYFPPGGGGGSGGGPNGDSTHPLNVKMDWTDFPGAKPSDITDLKNALTGGTYTGGNGTPSGDYSYTGTEYANGNVSSLTTDLNSTWTGLASGAQSSGLYGLASGFFNASIPAGVATVVHVSGGQFGNHDFDFSVFSPIFPIVRSVIILVFAFLSVKVVMKGGA